MDAKMRKKVIGKMYAKALITREEYENQSVSDDRIEMFIKGIILLEGEMTVKGQMEARQKALKACQKSNHEELIKEHEKQLNKLSQLRMKMAKKRAEDEQKNQVKMKLTRASTQYEEVKNHLEEFKSITSLEAFTEYGITRLSHYIYRLRKEEGWIINTINITKTNRYGNPVTFAKYHFPEQSKEKQIK